MDADLLESLSEKLYCGRPSSYHYTKALAESLVMHNAQNLRKANKTYQSAIVRPSIVTPTLNEPLPGWTNNYYGPTGYLVVCGKGVLRSMIVHKDKICDIVPVDIVANTAITAAFYISKQAASSGAVTQSEQPAASPVTGKLNGHSPQTTDAARTANGKCPPNGKFSSDEEDALADSEKLTNGKLTNGHHHLTNGNHQTNGKLTNGHHLTNGKTTTNGESKLTNGKLNGDSQLDASGPAATNVSPNSSPNSSLNSSLNGSPSWSPNGTLKGRHHKTMNESSAFDISQYLTVFNCVSGTANPISWGEIHSLCEPFLLKYPSIELFRYPGALLHSNKLLHQIILQLEHNIPAMLVDFIFKLLGHKPM